MKKYFLICLLLAIVGCKKHEIVPIPTSNVPVFKVTGTIDTTSVNYIAGDNNFELTNETKKVNNVSIFTASLNDDQYGVEMVLYDGNLDRKTHKYDTLNALTHLFYVPIFSTPLFSISKEDFSNAERIASIEWKIQGQQNSFLNTLEIYEPGKYTICADVTFNDQTKQSLCEEILVGFKRNSDYKLSVTQSVSNQFMVQLSNIVGNVQQFQWYLDDVLIGENQELQSLSTSNGFHVLTTKLTFSDGYVKEKSVLIDGNFAQRSIENFSSLGQFSTNTFDFKAKLKILINQQEFTTQHAENAGNKINIEHTAFYKLSNSGNPIYKVTGNMIGLVKAVNSSEMKPFNLNFVLGIEIPQ